MKTLIEFARKSPVWFLGFVVLLALAPLPFGSNRAWASDLLGLFSGLFLLLMLWKEQEIPSWSGSPPKKRIVAAVFCMSFVLFWSLVQILPWTPESWHHPVWREAGNFLGTLSGSISVNPKLFPESFLRLLTYIACFLLAFFGGRDSDNAFFLLKTLALAGLIYALYGLFAHALGSETILWYKKWAYQGFLTSTFVNKNSYAAYAGLGLLCALAFAWQKTKSAIPQDNSVTGRSRVVVFFDTLSRAQIAALFAPVVFLVALALTGSRAGVASSFFGIIVFILAFVFNRRARTKKGLMLIGGLAAVFLFAVFLGGEALLVRLDGARLGEDASMRIAGYALALQAIGDNPWLGYGLGTFDVAFRFYRDASLPLWFHHAHNDYLEMAMDLGLPAAGALFLAQVLLLSCCASGVWQRKKNGIYPALALGASALVAVHSLVDFSLHIPAIAATYAALLGLGVAQSWSSRDAKETSSPAAM